MSFRDRESQSSSIIQRHRLLNTSTNGGARSRGAPPRTAVSTLGYLESRQVICAISESRGVSPTIGLAFVDLETSQVVICQVCDTQTYVRTVQKLHIYHPSELIVMSSASFGQSFSKLLPTLEQTSKDIGCKVTLLDRRLWSENLGLEYIHKLAFSEDVESIKIAIAGNYFAVCCLAAVCQYIESISNSNFCSHSFQIKIEPSDGSMMIDVSTIASLELIQNSRSLKSKDCLFGLLNHTKTPMGSRLLKNNIMQPLTNAETLNLRYIAVEEMITKEDLFCNVGQSINDFQDADKLLTNLTCDHIPTFETISNNTTNVIILKSLMASIQSVHDALQGSESELLREIRNLCQPLGCTQVTDLINNIINEDVNYSRSPLDLRNNQVFAIKAGVNGLLDVTRQAYKENLDDVTCYVADLAASYNLPIHLKYDESRQFHLCVPNERFSELTRHPEFINVVQKKKFVEATTLDLLKRNQKIADSYQETMLLSLFHERSTTYPNELTVITGGEIIFNLIVELRQMLSTLFKTSEAIAMLDMLYAFAHYSITYNCVRPRISDTLAVQACRHPIKEKLLRAKFVPNDVFASQQTRFQIITGCNMSGKSTYIRAIALLVVMAQIGCFVPATCAVIPIHHQLFTRLCVDDSTVANVSTFSAEMQEAAFIIRNIQQNSIAIIDELGRGTSSRDGMAIALAIAEFLIKSRAFVWFVTHFSEIPEILAERNAAISLHLAVDNAHTDIVHMRYSLRPGPTPDSRYGLSVARLFHVPATVLRQGELVSETLREKASLNGKSLIDQLIARRRRLILGLKEHLLQAQHGRMEEKMLLEWLHMLRNDFVKKITQIGSGRDTVSNVHDSVVQHDLSEASYSETESSMVYEAELPTGMNGSTGKRPSTMLTSSTNTTSTEMLVG